MKRIAFVTTGMETGGAEMMLYKLLSGLSKDRFMPAVFSLTRPGKLGQRLQESGIPVHAAAVNGVRGVIPAMRDLYRAMAEFDPHLVQGWMYHGNLAALLISRWMKGRRPVLWAIRQSLYSLHNEKRATALIILLSSVLSRFVDRLIYNSSAGARHHESYGFRGSRRTVVPNGFDTDLFTPSDDARVAVRRELRVEPGTLLVGIIGRLHPMKDHANFCKAAARLASEMPEVRFVMAGAGMVADNPDIARLVRDLGLSNCITLLGERDDVPRLTAALDISVCSSFSEGFSNVVGEAMCCAVPCVVTNVGDCATVVGDTGVVVPARDHVALSSAIAHLLHLPREERVRLGRLARERIIEHYSLGAIVRRYEDLYSEFAQTTSPCAA